MDGHDEVETGEDRAEAEDEDAEDHGYDAAKLGLGRVRRVEGPTGVEASEQEREHREDGPDDPEVETEEVQPRECHVLGAEHDR